MADKIKTGTILIEEGALLPESLRFESEAYSKGWRLVKNLDGYGLDQKIREVGWTFFYMAGEANATVVGSDLEKTTRRAVKKVIASMKSDRFNCLEIGQATVRRSPRDTLRDYHCPPATYSGNALRNGTEPN